MEPPEIRQTSRQNGADGCKRGSSNGPPLCRKLTADANVSSRAPDEQKSARFLPVCGPVDIRNLWFLSLGFVNLLLIFVNL